MGAREDEDEALGQRRRDAAWRTHFPGSSIDDGIGSVGTAELVLVRAPRLRAAWAKLIIRKDYPRRFIALPGGDLPLHEAHHLLPPDRPRCIRPFLNPMTLAEMRSIGLAFNWGTFLGWSAVVGAVDWTVTAPMYLGGVAWCVVYDTIYAHQVYSRRLLSGRCDALKARTG